MKNLFTFALLTLSVLCFATGCAGDESGNENTYTCDFETIGQWTHHNALTKEQHHSGLFATITDSTHEFSQTFEVPVADLNVKQPKLVTVKAWVMAKTMDANAKLVISIEKDGQSIAWTGDETIKIVKSAMTWYEIQSRLPIGVSLPQGANLKVYGWNQGKGTTYWDDFTIQAE